MSIIHNVQQEENSIYFGNCLLYAGPYSGVKASDFSAAYLFNIGLKRDVNIDFITETVEPEFDDGEFNEIVDKEQVKLSVSLTELAPEKLAVLSGGMQAVTYTLGTQVVMGEAYDTVTLIGIKKLRLPRRSYTTSAPDLPTAIVVTEDTDTTPDTYVLDTDYEITGPDITGWCYISRKGTGIADGQTVRVSCTYTPAKMTNLVRGGLASEISPIVLRAIHVKRITNNLVYGMMVDVVRAFITTQGKIGFSSDKDKKTSLEYPYEFLGKIDTSQSTSDGQLERIVQLKGVSLTDLNMNGMPDISLAILKDAAVSV